VQRQVDPGPRGQRLQRHLRRRRLEPGRHIGPRPTRRQEHRDLGLGLLARRGDELVDVVIGRVRRQQHDAAQVQAPLRDRGEDPREAPRRPGRADALEGSVLAGRR
jgi:hypothetical protein